MLWMSAFLTKSCYRILTHWLLSCCVVILLVYDTQHSILWCSTLIRHILQLLQYAARSIDCAWGTSINVPHVSSIHSRSQCVKQPRRHHWSSVSIWSILASLTCPTLRHIEHLWSIVWSIYNYKTNLLISQTTLEEQLNIKSRISSQLCAVPRRAAWYCQSSCWTTWLYLALCQQM